MPKHNQVLIPFKSKELESVYLLSERLLGQIFLLVPYELVQITYILGWNFDVVRGGLEGALFSECDVVGGGLEGSLFSECDQDVPKTQQ